MTIHFLTMSDFLGRLRPFRPFMAGEQAPSERGGIARVATFIKRLQQKSPLRVIPLVAGLDLMGPGLELLGGETEITALTMAGFVAAVPGIHEFESGPDLAGMVLRSVPFPILSANLKPTHSNLAGTVTAHAIFNSGPTRVGVFGLAMAGPGASLAPDPLFRTGDLIETAQEQVAILRAIGCEVIVALTHIGTPSDCQVAARVSGIHAIFGGHSHTPTSHPEIIVSPDGWQTLVTQAGTAGASLGHLSLTLRDGRIDLEKTKWTLIPIDQSIEPDPDVEEYLDQSEAKVQAALTCVVGKLATEADGRRGTVSEGESALANFVADALRQRAGSDVALISASQLAGDASWAAGFIDLAAVYRILPFGGALCVFDLTGRDVLRVLELSASALTAPDRLTNPLEIRRASLLHCSGLRVVYRRDGSLEDVVVDSGNGFEPVDPSASYQVAGSSFFTHGGDGYKLLAGRPFRAIGLSCTQALADILRSSLNEIRTSVDGRLQII